MLNNSKVIFFWIKIITILFFFSSYFSYSLDKDPPRPQWTFACKGAVNGATVTDMPNDPSIRSNLAKIELDSQKSYNYILEWAEFIPGVTVTTTWKLKVKNYLADAKAVITFSDAANNDTTITIEYIAPELIIEPKFYSFGNVPFGSTSENEFTIRNISNKHIAFISSVDFKSSGKNYKINGLRNPTILKPGEFTNFYLQFEAKEYGVFRDSIGASDSCATYYSAFIEAKVGEPEIRISDIDFGKVKIGNTSEKMFILTNTGNTELVVNSYRGPFNSTVFQLILPKTITEISDLNPLKLDPLSKDTFKIRFTPNTSGLFLDSIIFRSDASKSDSICYIRGEGSAENIFVTERYNWGRKRIDLSPRAPSGPYPPEEEIIKITNSDNVDFKIIRIDSTISDKSDAFKFNRSAFDNLTIPAQTSITIPVTFHPLEIGEHRLILNFINEYNLPLQTELTGTGTAANTKNQIYQIGTTFINDYNNPKSSIIEIENLRWQFEDTLYIYDLISVPTGNEISTDGINYGTEGFRLNKSTLGLPATHLSIPPGEKILINIDFVAQRFGTHSAKLKPETNSYEITEITLIGEGLERNLTGIGDTISICADEVVDLKPIIINYSNNPIQIDSIKIIQNSDFLKFKNPADANTQFILEANSEKDIFIEFNPTGRIHNEIAKLEIYSSFLNEPLVLYIWIESLKFEIASKAKFDKNYIQAGENFIYTIQSDNFPDLTKAHIKMFEIQIVYPNDFLYLDLSRSSSDDLLRAKFNIQEVKKEKIYSQRELEKVTFKFESIGNSILNGNGDILKLTFLAYLPWYSSSDENFKSKVANINHKIIINEGRCTHTKLHIDTVALSDVCATKIRQIVIPSNQYSMNVYPNPANENINITFTKPFDNHCILRIYNANGLLVADLINQNLPKGSYDLKISLNGFHSGAYLCVFSDGSEVIKTIFTLIK